MRCFPLPKNFPRPMSKVNIRMKTDYVRNDGTCAIYAQVYLNGTTVKLPIDIYVEPMFWDQPEQQVKSFHPQADDLNMIIDQARTNIFEIRKRYMLQQKELTPEALRSEYKNFGGSDDFIKWITKEVEIHKLSVAAGTYTKYKSVLAKFKEFKPQVMFSDLKPELFAKFQIYCQKKGNNANTTNKSLKIIKVFVNIAVRRDLIKENPFDHVKLHKGKAAITYLTMPERDKLLKMLSGNYTSDKHKRVLLYFLFACYTGLRISDVKRLRWENIISNTIYITPYKTRRVNNETIIIPLGKTAQDLLSKCIKRPRNHYVFDVISDQKTNDHLKEIADLVGIRKSLHFHVARHTFATLFYEKTNDLATLQKLLGHSSIAQTMVYAHVSDQLRRDQMAVFDN